MRNQKGLSLVEALLILVVIIIGSVGCSRQEAGKSLGNAGGASEPGAKQVQQQKGQPEKTDETAEQIQQQRGRSKKTDETADWENYICSKGKFSLRYPRQWVVGPLRPLSAPRDYECNGDSSFSAGANHDLVAECGTEYFGQIYVTSMEGNQLDSHKLETDKDFYQDLSSRKVTVDKIECTRESGTAISQFSEKFEEKYVLPGLPDGTKVVIYLFYAHGRTYIAQYNQRIDEPDISRDFDLMVTKTLKFSK